MNISLLTILGVLILGAAVLALVVLAVVVRYNLLTLQLVLLGALMRLGDVFYPWAKAFIDARSDPPEPYHPEEFEVLIALDKPSLHAKAFPPMMREISRIPLRLLQYIPYMMIIIALGMFASMVFPLWQVIGVISGIFVLMLVPMFISLTKEVFYQYWARKWDVENTVYALFTHVLLIIEAHVPKDIFWGTGGLRRNCRTVSSTRTIDVKDTKTAAETAYIGLKGKALTPFESKLAQFLAAAKSQPEWLRRWLKLPDNVVEIGTIPGRSILEADVLDATEDPNGFFRLLIAARTLSGRIQLLRDMSMRAGLDSAVGKHDDSAWKASEAPAKLNRMLTRLAAIAQSGIVLIGPQQPEPIQLIGHPAGRFKTVHQLLALSQSIVQNATSLQASADVESQVTPGPVADNVPEPVVVRGVL